MRVALIGTSFGGLVQLPALALVPEVEVVAIVSGRLERARALAAQAGVPHAFDDYRAMLDRVEVDLVSIASPPATHLEMVLAAADHGCHIICEKPLALNSGEAERMLQAMQTHALVHAVDHEFRYYPALATFKRELDQGVLGDVRMLRLVWRSPARATPEKAGYSWWSERTAGGGVLAAVASHWIDAFRWWFGEPRDIKAQFSTFVPRRPDSSGLMRPVETEDTASVLMRLGDAGVHATIDVSMAVGPAGMRLEAFGTRGSLISDGYTDLRFAPDGAQYSAVPLIASRYTTQPGHLPNVAAFAELVTDVRDAIRGTPGCRPFPTFEDGVAVQRALDTAYEMRPKLTETRSGAD